MSSPLSLTGKRWTITNRPAEIPSAIIARLMAERGLQNEPLPPPDIFPDMPQAVERMRRAVADRERVAIFGDYDCDGITAAALLVRWLRGRNAEPLVRLPHRVRDGYGLKIRHIDEFAAAGVSLLVTVDTGITAIEEVAAARARGIDVIVTDHHHPRDEVPRATAILHPALAPTFAPPHPSGAGVAFHLVRALYGGDAWEGSETDLALAAIGTIADLVPLTGTNRTMVMKGLRALNGLTDGPLALLARSIRSAREASAPPLTSQDIAFRLAPRINAAGRMEDPAIALRAILEGGEAIAAIERLNTHRQGAMNELFAEAWKMLELPAEPSATILSHLPPLIVLVGAHYNSPHVPAADIARTGSMQSRLFRSAVKQTREAAGLAGPAAGAQPLREGWARGRDTVGGHPAIHLPEGLIGLVAGKITEATGHPSFVVTVRDGECTASLRSTAAYHITEGLERLSGLLSTFGGHAQAAGCTFPARNFAELKERLGADIAARTDTDHLRPSLDLTAALEPRDITLSFLEHLKDLEPFGQGNPEPAFLLPAVRLESVRRVGEDGKHLQARIGGIKSIGWRLGRLADHASHPLDIACRISVDTWNGRRAPQIVMEDLRVPISAGTLAARDVASPQRTRISE